LKGLFVAAVSSNRSFSGFVFMGKTHVN